MAGFAQRWLRLLENPKAFSVLEKMHELVEVGSFLQLERETGVHNHQIRRFIAGDKRHKAALTRLIVNRRMRKGKGTELRISVYGCIVFHILQDAPEKARELITALANFYQNIAYQRARSRLIPEDERFDEVYEAMMKCPRCVMVIEYDRAKFYQVRREEKPEVLTESDQVPPQFHQSSTIFHQSSTKVPPNLHQSSTTSLSHISILIPDIPNPKSQGQNGDKNLGEKPVRHLWVGNLEKDDLPPPKRCLRCGKETTELKVFKVEDAKDMSLSPDFGLWHLRWLCAECYTEIARKYWAMKAGEAGWQGEHQ